MPEHSEGGWTTRSERVVFDSAWVRVGHIDVTTPSGERIEDHHVVELSPIALAVVVNDEDEILLLWKYRFVTRQWGYELPGGMVDTGESAVTSAARETAEESGWEVTSAPEHLLTVEPLPGQVRARTDIYLFRGARDVGEPTDPEEVDTTPEWVPVSRIPELVDSQKILGSSTALALLYYYMMTTDDAAAKSHPSTGASAFTQASSRAVLDEACRTFHLDASGAELLRLGENAIYCLTPSHLVVRIARSSEHWEDAGKEINVSCWLHARGVRAVRSALTDRPLDVRQHPVTFWQYVDGRGGGPEDVREFGELLHRLHQLDAPTEFELPIDDPLGRVQRRIERAQVPTADQETLSAKLDMLIRELPKLTYPLAPCVVHGDAHVENLMVDAEGPMLIDFERVGWGHPEWDLAVTATEYMSAGFWTAEQYAAFVDSYGYDITEWGGFDLLRQTHELKMTSWLMQNVNESDAIREEYELRMEAIRGGRSSRPWTPF